MPQKFDVLTLGETMIRLTPPSFQRLAQSRTLEIEIGGTESNVAVGLARLGLSVCWLSRLTDNPYGRLIAGELTRQGVDTTHVVWTDADRVGFYHFERGQQPRPSRVIYDRAGSAMSQMQPADLDAALLTQTKHFHTTGISLAIGVSAEATTQHAVTLARQANVSVSFDVNYRAKLWSPAAAQTTCTPLMQQADVIFITHGDAQTMFGAPQDAQRTLDMLGAQFPQATIVVTLGKAGAIARSADGERYEQAIFPAQPVDRLGSGDAFAAGFLYGWLRDNNVPLALRYGAAMAALKYTILGELPLVERHEVEALVKGDSAMQVRR